MRSLYYNYRTGISAGFDYLGTALALLGGLFLIFAIIDFGFFAGRGTTNLIIYLWEVTA